MNLELLHPLTNNEIQFINESEGHCPNCHSELKVGRVHPARRIDVCCIECLQEFHLQFDERRPQIKYGNLIDRTASIQEIKQRYRGKLLSQASMWRWGRAFKEV